MALFLLILLSISINTIAQLLLKAGMNRIGHFEFALHNFGPIFVKIASNYFIIAGLAAYVLSVTTWLLVLSRSEVSYAYPLTSLGYILTALAGYFLLNEGLSPLRIVGILVIILGVILVTRS
jgi:multidrug transporter EmrE-like cation transporter